MKKILVIEDEPEMRRNLTTILRLEKFRPLPAENGRVGVLTQRPSRSRLSSSRPKARSPIFVPE
jgi:DNA-binding response OmpR family regulator